MDPYEYLLSKLNVTLKFSPNVMARFLYIKSETDTKLISKYIPIGWTHEYIFKFFRNIYSSKYYRQHEYDKALYHFCQQLSCFPDELESTEHVDLLLTVNGMNKRA